METSFHMQISVHFHVNKTNFHQYERLRTRTCFETEAKGNLEIAYCQSLHLNIPTISKFEFQKLSSDFQFNFGITLSELMLHWQLNTKGYQPLIVKLISK